jgi:F0F1-type ATP synthase membrane subunit b/b'
MVSINFTALIFALSFLAFAFALKAIFFKPLMEIVSKRERINEERKNEIKVMAANITKKIDALSNDHKLMDAKYLAHDIVADARKSATQEKESLVRKSAENLGAEIQEILDAIDSDEQALLENSRSYVEELAGTMAHKLNEILQARRDANTKLTLV